MRCYSYFDFTSATDVVTVYVFQEPSLLSSLQDNGLTDVVLHALLIKDVSFIKRSEHHSQRTNLLNFTCNSVIHSMFLNTLSGYLGFLYKIGFCVYSDLMQAAISASC